MLRGLARGTVEPERMDIVGEVLREGLRPRDGAALLTACLRDDRRGTGVASCTDARWRRERERLGHVRERERGVCARARA